MDVNEYLKATHKMFTVGGHLHYVEPRPWVICKDGFTLSVQASKNHGCSPRLDIAERYLRVEIGYFEEDEQDIIKYLKEFNDSCVISYILVERVQELLDAHGGIDDSIIVKRNLVKKLCL